MARAYGSNATLLLKRETTYGTRATGDYWQMPFNSCNLGSEQGLLDDPVLGYGRDPSPPLRDVIKNEGDIAIPVDPRFLGFWLTGLLGDPTTTTVKAEGYIEFATNPSATQTITINGEVFTFVSTSPSGNQIQIQGTVTQTIDAAVTALNASSDSDVNVATYSRPSGTQKLKVQFDTAGVAGNNFTLAASHATVSAAKLQGGGYKHTFASGQTELPSYSLETGMPNVPAYFMHTGVIMNSLALQFQRSGAAAATINAVAQAEKRNNGSLGGTPDVLGFTRISQFQGAIKSAGENIANLTAGSITYSNNLERIETIRDDGLIDGADPTIASLSGSIDVRFSDTDLIDKASGGIPVDLTFSYTSSPNLILTVTAHEVWLPKPKLAITGPGGVQASFEFRGARNADAGRMLTIELLNDVAGSDYL